MTDLKDPYSILGVSSSSSSKEIRTAYRRKAKALHPDTNPTEKHSSDAFKALTNAYRIIGDEVTRRMFDDGQLDSSGLPKAKNPNENKQEQPKAPATSRTGTGRSQQNNGVRNNFAWTSQRLNTAETTIKQWLARHKNKVIKETHHGRSHLTMQVSFKTAIRGGNQRLELRDGHVLTVKVPAGVKSGQIIRLRNQGERDLMGQRRDALIKVQVESHKMLTRDGDNIRIDLPVSLSEAVLGGRVRIPTVDGTAEITIPEGANSGQILRLRGKGIARTNVGSSGDQLVRLLVQLPSQQDPELQAFASRWSQRNYDPRGPVAI